MTEEQIKLLCKLAVDNSKKPLTDAEKEVLKSGNPEKEILDLKEKLLETDYKAIKYAEGEITDAEYEPIKQRRREWRRRINELEKEIQ